MNDYFDFDKKLKEGNKAEEQVKQEFKRFMSPISNHFLSGKMYYYGLTQKDTNKQQNGIDGKYHFKFEYDVKVNKYFPKPYRKILLERRHEGINNYYEGQETRENGWLYYSKSDIIIFLWWAQDHTHFFSDGYYLFLNNIRKWFDPRNYEEHRNSYPSKRGNFKWWTWNYIVPILDFPNNCILRIDKTIFRTDIEKSYFYKWFDVLKKEPIVKLKQRKGLGKWL